MFVEVEYIAEIDQQGVCCPFGNYIFALVWSFLAEIKKKGKLN